jgi:regulator of protease activity HflC (stomatin/prohibitin superfamily)
MSYDAERIAQLLRALPPAPVGWVEAAQELPRARRGLDEIVARAEADAAFRARLVADLEAALAAEGYEPSDALLEALRERLRGR